MPLLAGPGTLGVGGHKLPFVIALPAGLPPSVSLRPPKANAKASVSYKIKVMVDQVGSCGVLYAGLLVRGSVSPGLCSLCLTDSPALKLLLCLELCPTVSTLQN